MLKPLYIAIGVDCDPDRDSKKLTFRGIENIDKLLELPDVKFTFNVRIDRQIERTFGEADDCTFRYYFLWQKARSAGHEIAWHLHYYDINDEQWVSPSSIRWNIECISAPPKVVHMGWTYQDDYSIQQLRKAGVEIDYSPLPRMKYAGRNGSDCYDWSQVSYRPYLWHGMKMIPAYTAHMPLLAKRFKTERVMLTTCTKPFLYRGFLQDFFRGGHDFFVSYFHIDEIISALPDWRKYLYSFGNLKQNIADLRVMAEQRGYEPRFVTISELAEVLFPVAE